MERIALCDNEPPDREELHLFLEQYGTRWGQEIGAALSSSPLELVAGMDELLEHLSAYRCFLRVHRSCFVDMDHIRQFSYRAVILCCGAKIPVPRGRYNELKNSFLEYATRKGQVLL